MDSFTIRKSAVVLERTHVDCGRVIESGGWPIVSSMVVLTDPWEARFHEQPRKLDPGAIDELATTMIEAGFAALNCRGSDVEAVGIGAVVGTNLSIEHAAEILHTGAFGGAVRRATDGTAGLVSVDKRGPAGTTIDVPLKHKDDHTQRSHHMSQAVSVGDAPLAGELLIALAISTRARPWASHAG